MPTTTDLVDWAKGPEGILWPVKQFFKEKKGRGIYRRWIIQIPTKGTGSVDYSVKHECYPMEATLSCHQITGNGGDGKLLTRDRSCHQCDECWERNWGDCSNSEFVGEVWPVTLRTPKQDISPWPFRISGHVALNCWSSQRTSVRRVNGSLG